MAERDDAAAPVAAADSSASAVGRTPDGKKPNLKDEEQQSPLAVSDTDAVAINKDLADESVSDAGAGEKHKLKKRKTSKEQQSSSGAGTVAVDKDVTDDESDTRSSGCKESNAKKRKTAQVTVSEALLVDDASNAGEDGSIGKMDGGVRPGSFSDEAQKVQDVYSPQGSPLRAQRKKLLVLDLNGLLADINQDKHNSHLAHAKVRGKLVFQRPHCDDFLRFCFYNFEVGIWSSRLRENVDAVVDVLFKDLKQHLLFSWDSSKCTVTGHNTLERKHKPLVLKEMYKIWNKEDSDLPWDQGDYSPSNTLLVDDSPYKALRNPPHTAIFPHPYSYKNEKDDSLGPRGELRLYLENLATVDDVQHYVKDHPFGQPAITRSDPNWSFYLQIVDGKDS
ncbi:hypothetical protein ACP70R_014638 [Stipagrostis hirtigluma subsp. patula]